MLQITTNMEDQEEGVKRLSVPIGLEDLMTGLTREVLRKKPKDIYNFASDYFSHLLALRESGTYKEPTTTSITYIRKATKSPPILNGKIQQSKSFPEKSSTKHLSRQVSIREPSPTFRRTEGTSGRLKRSGTPKFGKNTLATQDKDKVKRSTPTNKSKFDNLETVKEDALKAATKKQTATRKVIQKHTESKHKKTEPAPERDNKKDNRAEDEKFVPKSSSVEEDTNYIKDGRLTVTPPKRLKAPTTPSEAELPTTLIVPNLAQ